MRSCDRPALGRLAPDDSERRGGNCHTHARIRVRLPQGLTPFAAPRHSGSVARERVRHFVPRWRDIRVGLLPIARDGEGVGDGVLHTSCRLSTHAPGPSREIQHLDARAAFRPHADLPWIAAAQRGELWFEKRSARGRTLHSTFLGRAWGVFVRRTPFALYLVRTRYDCQLAPRRAADIRVGRLPHRDRVGTHGMCTHKALRAQTPRFSARGAVGSHRDLNGTPG